MYVEAQGTKFNDYWSDNQSAEFAKTKKKTTNIHLVKDETEVLQGRL